MCQSMGSCKAEAMSVTGIKRLRNGGWAFEEFSAGTKTTVKVQIVEIMIYRRI